VEIPKEEKAGVPAYMVSFGDMVTLLLTFFILLVALADTQEAGLVAAGQGPIVKHILAAGKPGVLSGRLRPDRQLYKRDTWWVPNQEGDPDEIEEVVEKLEREIPVRFKAGEASISYERDRLVLRIPARITFSEGRPEDLSPEAKQVLSIVARVLQRDADRRVRISGDVPTSRSNALELSESARNGRLVFQYLQSWHGVRPHQMSLWGWGATRLRLPSSPNDPRNRGVTIEVFDSSKSAADAAGGNYGR
jgi:chemotaxis protein MotB